MNSKSRATARETKRKPIVHGARLAAASQNDIGASSRAQRYDGTRFGWLIVRGTRLKGFSPGRGSPSVRGWSRWREDLMKRVSSFAPRTNAPRARRKDHFRPW